MSQPKKAKKKRLPEGSVCKPCWELKYCPFGPLVEFYPLLRSDGLPDIEISAVHDKALVELMSGTLETKDQAWDSIDRFLYSDPDNWKCIEQYDPEEVGCRIWGHVCPVFFTQSGATETNESRAHGRSVPRPVMLKVVRRDNHICQECHQYVPDDQLEFDHVIPLSRGGATSVDNLRLLCRACNRRKSDKIDSLLIE